MIELDKLFYWYPGREQAALADVSLRIPEGESVCVLGRNGSGKSTLVRLIGGLLKPNRGRVLINGQLRQENDLPGQIAVLFQNPENQMVATVVEKEIAFALENRSVPLDDMLRSVQTMADRFGIVHLTRRITHNLSGGEQQKVALASVMIQNPLLLVLDEPDAFLDQAGKRKLAAQLKTLAENFGPLTEIRVTQNLKAAANYDRVVVMDQGRIAADGRPAEVLTDDKLLYSTGLKVNPDAIPKIHSGSNDQLHSSKSRRIEKINFSEISFGYPGQDDVISRLSFVWSSGETIAVAGPTGSGKSTLGLLAVGILEPTDGSITYRDQAGTPLDSSVSHGEITAVLQQPERQFFLESCAEEIAFGPKNLNRPLSKDQITEQFRLVGLDPDKFSHRDPFTLSTGEKRRLAFAAVLAMKPRMIVFDEPTSGLDPEGTAGFIALSRSLKAAGVGQMLITHDSELIRVLAGRVIHLQPRNSSVLAIDDYLEVAQAAS